MRIVALIVVALLGITAAKAEGDAIGYAETKSIIANETMMTYDPGHGTQVEYIAKNGKTYLLYPGNAKIVKGQWKLDRTANPNVFNLCFRYPSNSYNPVTKQAGGGWDCQPAGFYLMGVRDHLQGDVLGLSKSAQVPFVLEKRKTKLSDLMRKLKK